MKQTKEKWSQLPKNLRPIRIKPSRRPNKRNLKMTYMEKCGHTQKSPMSELVYNIRKEMNIDNHSDQ